MDTLKRCVSDLALFGGPPAFAEPVHVGRPNIGNAQELSRYLADILERRWLTNNGPVVQCFESRVEGLLGVKHCVAVCNATLGLQVLGRALGLTGEVVMPAFTFVATAHAFNWIGLEPVFCDVSADSHNIDPDEADALVSPRTSALIGLHCWGQPCDAVRLGELGARRGLSVLFDAAHAFGCSLGQRMVGNYGNAEVFSFHATKFVNSFEGGAVTTNDDRLAAEVRLLINFGFSGYDSVVSCGTNAKMSEIHAAMGLVSLDAMAAIVRANRDNHLCYARNLSHFNGVRLLRYPENAANNYQYVVAEIDPVLTSIARDDLLAVLHAEGVLARRYFYPGCHRMAPYASRGGSQRRPLPNTERLVQRVLVLPSGTAMTTESITQVTELLDFCIRHGEEISSLVRQQLRSCPIP